jgi:hypothetical protein
MIVPVAESITGTINECADMGWKWQTRHLEGTAGKTPTIGNGGWPQLCWISNRRRRILGYRHLPALRHALQVELNLVSNYEEKLA